MQMKIRTKRQPNLSEKDQTEKTAKFYRALADPARLKIIDFLLNKKECVCICKIAGFIKKDQSVAFRHVQILKDTGIVKTCKQDKFLMCCINDKKRAKQLIRLY